MKISVIIPAHNAARFIVKAIGSAIMQEQTAEVIVIDDGSVDETLRICNDLKQRYPILKVLQHADHKNHGAGPSRNLGIHAANQEFIAFLDADDFFLENRFLQTEKVFLQYPDADGVYECLGIYFEDKEAEQKWFNRFDYTLTTIKEVIAPEELIYKMAPLGKSGWFSGDALVVRKSIFEKCGYYSDLRLSQDTELFMRMAITARLYPGDITNPVACRRVHSDNRITGDKQQFYLNRKKLWRSLLHWTVKYGIRRKWIALFANKRLKDGLVAAKLDENIFRKMWLAFSALIQYIIGTNWFYFLGGPR